MLLDQLLRLANEPSAVTHWNASWPCLLEQSAPEKPYGLESAATSSQVEMTDEGSWSPCLRIGRSERPLDRPSLRWCLSAFQDDNPQILAKLEDELTMFLQEGLTLL